MYVDCRYVTNEKDFVTADIGAGFSDFHGVPKILKLFNLLPNQKN